MINNKNDIRSAPPAVGTPATIAAVDSAPAPSLDQSGPAVTRLARRHAWKSDGKRLNDLGQIVAEAIDAGGWPPPKPNRAAIDGLYTRFRALGNTTESRRSFEYALRLFLEARSLDDVVATILKHRSLGDFWREMTDVERREAFATGRREHATKWQASSETDRVATRMRVATEALADVERDTEPVVMERLRRRLPRAQSEDLALKFLEHGVKPGETRAYPGVVEPMRSSWEALFARAVLKQPTRFYMYEPMGFPLFDPVTGTVTAYHPDFIVFRHRPDGTLRASIVEIKGRVFETGRRKIELFRQHYLKGDFSNLGDEEARLARAAVQVGKRMCVLQCGFEPGPLTPFRVYGWTRWCYDDGGGRRDRGFSLNGTKGFIARLAVQLPDGLPLRDGTPLSNTERERLAREISHGTEEGKPLREVPAHGPRIQRSQERIVSFNATTSLYVLTKSFVAAFSHFKPASQEMDFWSVIVAQACLEWQFYNKEQRNLLLAADHGHELYTPQSKPDTIGVSSVLFMERLAALLAAKLPVQEAGYRSKGMDLDAQLSGVHAANATEIQRVLRSLKPAERWDEALQHPDVQATFGRTDKNYALLDSTLPAPLFIQLARVDSAYVRQQIEGMVKRGEAVDFRRVAALR